MACTNTGCFAGQSVDQLQELGDGVPPSVNDYVNPMTVACGSSAYRLKDILVFPQP